jgi:DNA (cytosine-5)-methyltransferase 1
MPYGDFIHVVRQMLEETGLPYVIENVEQSPLLPERTITLCGTMPIFQGDQRQLHPQGSDTLYDPVPMTKSGGLRVIRHRLFESNIALQPPDSPRTPYNPDGKLPHKPNYPKYHPFNGHPLAYTTKKSYDHFGKLDPWKDFVLVYGGGNAPAEACRDAMGIDWMNRDEICEAIPPVYTQFVGRQILLAKDYAAPLPVSQLALF